MIALVGIIVQDESSVEKVNAILHDYGDCIVGRMGLPLRSKSMNVISIVLDTDSGRITCFRSNPPHEKATVAVQVPCPRLGCSFHSLAMTV